MIMRAGRSGSMVYKSSWEAGTVYFADEVMYSFEIDNIEGDLVWIEIPGNNKILSLAEVQVFGKDTTYNVALATEGAIAFQPTTYKHGGEASLAIDGSTNGNYHPNVNNEVTHTKEQTNPFWRVNFPEMKTISRVKVYNRLNGGNAVKDRLVGFVLTIGLDEKEVYTSAKSDAGVSRTTKDVYSFDIDDIEGDMVKITLLGTKRVLSLAEVEVFVTYPFLSPSNTPSAEPSSRPSFSPSLKPSAGPSDTPSIEVCTNEDKCRAMATEGISFVVRQGWRHGCFVYANYPYANLQTIYFYPESNRQNQHRDAVEISCPDSSKSPSVKPSAGPSVSSMAPSSTICVDSEKLRYKNKKKKDCEWVGTKKVKQRCQKKWGGEGKKLYDFCPLTCLPKGLGSCVDL